MGRRIFVAGLLGGLALYLWGVIGHVVLPLGHVGIREFPNEEPVVAALRGNVTEPGLYFFPGMGGHGADITPEQRTAWEKKLLAGPVGILIYNPQGGEALSFRQLGTELASNIAAALVAAFLLSAAAAGMGSFGLRVLFVALLGLLVGLEVDASYWNWYGFPGNYTLAQVADHIVGWFAAGLVLAWRIK